MTRRPQAVVSGHDEVDLVTFAPQQRDREMNRVESTKCGWQRLGGTTEHGPSRLDDLHRIEKSEHRFSSQSNFRITVSDRRRRPGGRCAHRPRGGTPPPGGA